MKSIQRLMLSLLIVLAGTPLPSLGNNVPDVILLPDGVAGRSYQANIQRVLRESYQLKLETDARTSFFRWAFSGGEIPPGLVVRPSGTIVGTPRVARDEPYRFQVKVNDLAYSGSEALQLEISLTIVAHQVRLTQVRTPRLTPLYTDVIVSDKEAYTSRSNHAANSARSDGDLLANVFRKPTNRPTVYLAEPLSEVSVSAPLNRPATLKGSSSRRLIADTSYDPNLISPVLNTLKANPLIPSPRLPSSTKVYEVDVAKGKTTGDKIRGPAKIRLKNLNILRYDIRVGQDVTFPTAPDLTLPFIPPIPDQPEQLTGVNAFVASNDAIDDKFKQLLVNLDPIETEKATQVNGVIETAISNTNTAKNNLEALVTTSDAVLTTGGGPGAIIVGLPPLIGSPGGGAAGEIDIALSYAWPDAKIENLLGRLQLLRNGLLTLPTTPLSAGDTTWDNWYKGANKASYDYVVSRSAELQNQLNGVKSSSTQGTVFQDAQSKLRRWKPILIGIRDGGVAGFEREFEVGCGFAFDTGKETKIKLIKHDRLADPGAGTTDDEIVTVVCSSPLSISAGFGFSNVDEKEFVFVQSTKPVTTNGQTTQAVINRFGFRNRSGFRTLPVVLLNTRVWEPTDTFALHVSTGAAVDIKTGQGGTDLEYIVGPSLSFWRSLFITPGLHIGRVNKLAGGFELDQEVPTGINEPPIEKSWKKGFVTTFTYKIR